MKDLAMSFVYALRGIFFCIKNERNMRIHICFTVYMFGYLLVYDFFEVSRTQLALLGTACSTVLMGELINTAIERSVDLACKEKNDLARIAKDCAAGAVLVGAIFAVICGIAILWQPDAFAALADYYSEKPLVLVILILSVLLSLLFIFGGPSGNIRFVKVKKKKNK